LKHLFKPLESVNKRTFYGLIAVEIIIFILLWFKFGTALIPSPIKVSQSILELVSSSDFYDGLIASLSLTFKGMFISIAISLLISYMYFLPVLKPVGMFIVKCRYLTLTGLIFLFTLLTQDGSQLKLSLLIFGIVPFFVTSMIAQLDSINIQEYELCKTLRMNNWQTWWEVVIIGRLDQVIETMRQNFAISWLMITMVEGLSMSEGGLGVMLLKANKYINLSKVFALMVIIFVMGIAFDYLLGKIRTWIFPYTKIGVIK
jgi:NitT/TauT family transport system permease protein